MADSDDETTARPETGDTSTDRDDETIARREAGDTTRSISNLDSIGDTMFVAITFFLTALATWTPFALDHLASVERARTAVVALILGCAVAIAACVFYLSRSLAPRGFYGTDVGSQFLNHPWLLWRNDDPGDVDKFRERRRAIESDGDLRTEYEAWLADYDSDAEISSTETFEFSRLLDYKLVARIKAHHTAYGVALFRIATMLFVVMIAVTLLAPFALQ